MITLAKLISLVSKMNVKINKHDAPFKPQIYQRKRRGQNRYNYTLNDYQTRNRSFGRDRDTSYRGLGSFGRNYRQHYRGRLHETILGMTMDETSTGNKGTETEVETITEILIERVLGMIIHKTEILMETGVE